jgi:orotidine-5'-phosphate decarboxylase
VSQAPFADRLCEAIRKKGTPAMLGIDPQWSELPLEFQQSTGTTREPGSNYFAFCSRIIEIAAERVAVVKFQMAFFEQAGLSGLQSLQHLAKRAKDAGLLVVLDGKRNDIGNTAAAYASAYLEESGWQADALTVNPYLGEEGLTPFVDAAKKSGTGVFILVRTSNPGAGKLQDALIDGRTVYSVVAEWVREGAERTKGDSKYSSVGAVVGATVPQQLADLRKQLPSSILLIPGYGAQGATAKDCVAAFDENGLGAVVNNSRGVLYAWKKPEYAGMHWLDASRAAVDRMIEEFKTVAPIR